jgi:hypothetical protein
MRDCITYWRRYMSLMAASRDPRRDPHHRRNMIRQAYIWLDEYFDAVEREVARNVRLTR